MFCFWLYICTGGLCRKCTLGIEKAKKKQTDARTWCKRDCNKRTRSTHERKYNVRPKREGMQMPHVHIIKAIPICFLRKKWLLMFCTELNKFYNNRNKNKKQV